MTLEEIAQLTGSVEGEKLEALKNAVISLVGAEKQRGIEAANKKGQETEKFRNALKDVGYDPSKYESIKAFLDYYKTNAATTQTKLSESEKVQQAFSALSTELESIKAELETTKREKLNNGVKLALTEAIGDRIYGADIAVQSLISGGNFVEEGGKFFAVDGDTKTPVLDFANAFVDSRTDIHKVSQRAGGESSGGDRSGNGGKSSVKAAFERFR